MSEKERDQRGRGRPALGDRKQINLRLPYDLLEELDRFCEETGRARNEVVLWALRELLDRWED